MVHIHILMVSLNHTVEVWKLETRLTRVRSLERISGCSSNHCFQADFKAFLHVFPIKIVGVIGICGLESLKCGIIRL